MVKPNAEEFREAALRHQWLNHVNDLPLLPPLISTKSLTKNTYEKVRKIHPKTGTLAPALYRGTRFDGKTRFFEMPHPAPYFQAVASLSEHWDKILDVIQSKQSEITPTRHPNDPRVIIFNKRYHSPEFRVPRMAYKVPIFNQLTNPLNFINLGMARGQVIKLDLANFFSSIYTHALDWSIMGARSSSKNENTPGKEVDTAFQKMRTMRTDGVGIGPVTSNIAGEIILQKLDKLLLEKMKEGDLYYTRAVDDITILIKEGVDPNSLINEVASILSEDSLSLNSSKQKISPYRAYLKGHVSTIIQQRIATISDTLSRKNLPIVFSELINISEEKSSDSLLKYGWKMLCRPFLKKFPHSTDSTSADSTFATFMALSWEMLPHNPHMTAEVVYTSINAYPDSALIAPENFVRELLIENLERGFTDAATWLIYYAKLCDFDLHPVLVEMKFFENSTTDAISLRSRWLDSFVALMLLSLGDDAISETLGIIFNNTDHWVDGRTDRWSEYWPIRYELFVQSVIKVKDLTELERPIFEALKEGKFSFFS